jgi:hypothetical protein
VAVLRALLLFALIAAGLLVATPFVLSSWYIDERGVEIAGKVMDKREFVYVRDSEWEHKCEVMVWYQSPNEPGGGYVVANLEPERFDRLRQGGTAPLRYLRRQDLPRAPLVETLRNMRILPVAKVVGQVRVNRRPLRALAYVAGGILLLVVWRWLRWPRFPWAVAAGVIVLLIGILNSEFPRPLPEPKAVVRQTSGRVASISRIDHLFSGERSKGMKASQPIQVVGVRFVPAGAVEPVVAADLIDEGSMPNLKVDAPVTVSYEQDSPRTARIEGGTREFAERNWNGAILAAAVGTGAILGIFAVILIVGRAIDGAFRRIVQRR